MPKLNTGNRSETVQKIGDFSKILHMRVQPYSVAAMRDASVAANRRRLHNYESGAAQREAP